MDDDIEALVKELGERVGRINRQRRENGEDPFAEEFLEMGALDVGEIGIIVEANLLGGKGGLNLLVPTTVLVIDLLADPFEDRGEFRLGGHPVRGEGN